MRTSQFLIATLRETPADAEIISHQLMLRAGLIRQVAAGVYNWLPLGHRVLRKVETVVREEMNRSGAQEVLLPAIQPAELWRASGRWGDYGPELLRLTDRHQRDFCFGPTHEEVVTTLAKSEIRPVLSRQTVAALAEAFPMNSMYWLIQVKTRLLFVPTPAIQQISKK